MTVGCLARSHRHSYLKHRPPERLTYGDQPGRRSGHRADDARDPAVEDARLKRYPVITGLERHDGVLCDVHAETHVRGVADVSTSTPSEPSFGVAGDDWDPGMGHGIGRALRL
jgi:hypothetical protein